MSILKVPATHSQKALHFIQLMQPDLVSYNIPFEYRFAEEIDTTALKIALEALCERHDIFRTHFIVENGAFFQIVSEHANLDHEIIDGAGLTEKQVQERCQQWAQQPFDLTKAPLFRSRLIHLSEGWAWCLCFHHIAFDHLAILQFTQELDSAYQRAQINPAAISREPLSLSLVDYGVWQHENHHREYFTNAVAYWEKAVPDPSVMLDLPTDFTRPPVLQAKGQEIWFSFQPETVKAARQSAKSFQVSRYLLTMTHFAILLHRYSKTEQFLLGTHFANRSDQMELQSVLGCFVSTLPLPFDFSDSPSFATLLARTQAHFKAIFERQDVPLEYIIEKLNPPREAGSNPLFQVAFIYQDPPMTMSLGDAVGENKRLHTQSSKFDLSLWLWDDDDGGISGTFEFSTELFVESSVRAMLSVYERIIQGGCAEPQKSVADLALVNLLDPTSLALSGPVKRHDLSLGIHGLIYHTVQQYGQKIAVYGTDVNLSYDQLWERSGLVCEALKQQGVIAGQLIGVSLERTSELIVVLLGILRAGCAYVPLDPDYPKDRLSYMISHSKMPWLMTESAVVARTGHNWQAMAQDNAALKVIELGSLTDSFEVKGSSEAKDSLDAKANSGSQIESLAAPIDPDNVAYIIYTSGSTGKPKGIAVPHKAVVNFLKSVQITPGFSSEDRILGLTTLSFDISVLEIFLPLISGGALDLLPGSVSKDLMALKEHISARPPTVIQATPATWRMLVQAGWKGEEKAKLLVGGEAFPEDLVGDLLPRSSQLWNMYGPTEATVWATCALIERADDPVVIGAPFDNTRVYVLDERQNPVPIGVPGEMYIGGLCLAQGYWQRPDLTEQAFISHPLANELLYRTGDLVTRLTSGKIKYHNRLDNQVKIRGFRIELGEIEQILLQQNGVEQGAVVVQGNGFDKRLVAFFVKNQPNLTLVKLRRGLSQQLPKHMMPEILVPIDQLPTTPSGKIDRKHLASQEVTASGSTASPPTTPSEMYYAGLFCELLKRDSVSTTDSFFDIGGHSFLSLGILAAVKRDHDIVIPANALVLNTLGQLASVYPIQTQPVVDMATGAALVQNDAVHENATQGDSYAGNLSVSESANLASNKEAPFCERLDKKPDEKTPWWRKIFG